MPLAEKSVPKGLQWAVTRPPVLGATSPAGGEIAGKVVPALEAYGFEVGALSNSTAGAADLLCVMARAR